MATKKDDAINDNNNNNNNNISIKWIHLWSCDNDSGW